MKSTGRSSPAAAKKTRSKNPNKRQKPLSDPALRREYRQEARKDEREARHELAEAAHRRDRARHYEEEARKEQREGYRKEARHDREKAREELAKAREDTARARKHEARARRDEVKARRVGLASAGARGRGWILGGNDWHEGCAAAALANHLLLATGKRVSDWDVLALHVRAAGHPQARTSILATLEAAARWGLGDFRPLQFRPVEVHERDAVQQRRPAGVGVQHQAKLDALHLSEFDVLDDGTVALLDDHPPALAATPAVGLDADGCDVGRGDPALVFVHPAIVDLALTEAQRDQATWDADSAAFWGPHAALLASDRVVTWGREVPVTGAFLAAQAVGAWSVEWAART